MEAQILDLNRANIPACLVGSAQEDRQILSRIKNAEFKIVYSSPEYLCGENGIQLLDILKNRLLLIAIDERLNFKTNSMFPLDNRLMPY